MFPITDGTGIVTTAYIADNVTSINKSILCSFPIQGWWRAGLNLPPFGQVWARVPISNPLHPNSLLVPAPPHVILVWQLWGNWWWAVTVLLQLISGPHIYTRDPQPTYILLLLFTSSQASSWRSKDQKIDQFCQSCSRLECDGQFQGLFNVERNGGNVVQSLLQARYWHDLRLHKLSWPAYNYLIFSSVDPFYQH